MSILVRKKFAINLEGVILKNHKISTLIKLSEVYGAFLHSTNIGIYSANKIESHIIKCLEDQCDSHVYEENKKDCLHVISCALDTGGHTRLLEHIASFHQEKPDLLISRLAQPASKTRLVNKFDKIYYISSSSIDDNLNQLLSVISIYNRVILHIDPNDISIVVACGLVKKNTNLKVYFINHADHCFSYGFSICDALLNVSTFGELINGKRNHSGLSSFMGIPCETTTSLKLYANARKDLIKKSRTFVMAGHKSKIKSQDNTKISSIHLIKVVLSKFKKDKALVIGINWWEDWKWFVLKLRYFHRLKLSGSLPYEQYLLATKNADFFLDTHPMPGGTALVEQFLTGIAVTGLISPVQGYSVVELCKFDTLSQLIQFLILRKPAFIEDEMEIIIKNIINVHGFKAVSERYLNCIYKMEASENPMRNYLEWSGDIDFFLMPSTGRINLSTRSMKDLFIYSPLLFCAYAPYFSYLNIIIRFCEKIIRPV